MACSESPNVFAFMGEHWILTLIFAFMAWRLLTPLSVLVLVMAKRLFRA